MSGQNDVEALQTLVDFGLINMEACRRLSDMVRALQQFTGTRVAAQPRVRTTRGRRGTRGRFNISAEELRSLYKSMTIKEIADKHGVSPATVNLRLRDYGIQKEGRKAPTKGTAKAPSKLKSKTKSKAVPKAKPKSETKPTEKPESKKK